MTFVWKHTLLPDSAGDDDLPLLQASSEKIEGSPEIQDDFQACIESHRLSDNDLLTRISDKDLASRLYRIQLNARTSLDEQGVNMLYLAFGFLRYFESETSTKAVMAPLLLVPARLERKNSEAPWDVKLYEEEVVPNVSFCQLLKSDYGIDFPQPLEEELLESTGRVEDFLVQCSNAVKHYKRWNIVEDVALANFSFQKIAMWQDLCDNKELIAEHRYCRAIGGDDSDDLMPPDGGTPSPSQLDQEVRPHETFHILDADSSQLEAIIAAQRGLSFVLDGPPGTGKSQTIANIIAEFLAAGKRVLFVSEKAAALNVVKRRLDSRRIGDFCLECHSHKANKKDVIKELGRCLELGQERYQDQEDELEELYELRSQLNKYVHALHEVHKPLMKSPFQVHGALASLQTNTMSRCDIPDIADLTQGHARQMVDALRGLAPLRNTIENFANHPWRLCLAKHFSLTLVDDIKHHFAEVEQWLRHCSNDGSILVRLRLCSSASKDEVLAGFGVAKLVLDVPEVPSHWFPSAEEGRALSLIGRRRHTRLVAQAHETLHEHSKTLRELRQQLKEYREPVLYSSDLLSPEQLELGANAPLGFLKGVEPQTVRTAITRLDAAHTNLSSFRHYLLGVEQQVSHLTSLLPVRFRGQPELGLIPQLIALAELLASIGTVRTSWFDSNHHASIEHVLAQASTHRSDIDEIRRRLSPRLSTRAFADDTASLVNETPHFRKFLRRLTPAWRRFKLAASELYVSTPPTSNAALIADLMELRTYHRRKNDLQLLAREHVQYLPMSDVGDVEWTKVEEIIALARNLSGMEPVRQSLRHAPSTSDTVDRDALYEAAHKLRTCLEPLSRAGDEANQHCKFSRTNAGSLGSVLWDTVFPGEAVALVDAVLSQFQAALARLIPIAAVLHEASDIPLVRLVEDGSRLAAFRSLKREVDEAAHDAGAPETGERFEDHDWSTYASKAKDLLVALDKFAGEIPSAAVQAATEPAFRSELAGTVERLADAMARFPDKSWAFVCSLFDANEAVDDDLNLNTSPVDSVAEWLRARTQDVSLLRDWILLTDLRTKLRGLGIEQVLDEVIEGEVLLDEVESAFLARVYRMWLDAVYELRPALAGFTAEDHSDLIQRFKSLDQHSISGAHKRIRSALLAGSPRSGDNFEVPPDSELGVLKREVKKSTRHLSLRNLFKRIPHLLLKVKPCLMMSPLSVSTYLDSPDFRFDLVIFDEASQIRPYDAVCAIYRGQQLIVAGDPKQLPPTSFFDKSNDDVESGSGGEEGYADNLADYESILDVCGTIGLRHKRLKWHYRSRRESLIAFSNHHFYGNELVTFPSACDLNGTSAVGFSFVQGGTWKSGSGGGFNRVEARRVADLVFEHFAKHSDQTLGVVAMNVQQQLAILEEVERLLREKPELEPLLSPDRPEPFFVKNLENVQGDERDYMLFSVGYAPDDAGELFYRFGPLNRQGGERRLNVAITRARTAFTVVSSIRAQAIDLTRTQSQGAKLLRSFLDYAERGLAAIASEIIEVNERPADSPFELEVSRALEKEGLTVHRQVGCGRFRIDLGIVHPKNPSQYLLGVECDGATYHSSYTARDRDRLRQAVLERLGWVISRVWSTDWARNPRKQIDKLLRDYAARLNEADGLPNSDVHPDPQPDEDERPTIPAVQELPVVTLASIREASNGDIDPQILEILKACGKTAEEDLLVSVTRSLGFNRTGKVIRARIKRRVQALLKQGVIVRDHDRRLCVAD